MLRSRLLWLASEDGDDDGFESMKAELVRLEWDG